MGHQVYGGARTKDCSQGWRRDAKEYFAASAICLDDACDENGPEEHKPLSELDDVSD